MSLPHVFSNSPPTNHPDGNKLYENFTYLEGLITGGQAIKSDTLANLKASAQSSPTTAFLAIPTDLKALLLYTGLSTAGPNSDGWVTIVSWETIS